MMTKPDTCTELQWVYRWHKDGTVRLISSYTET